MNPFGTALSNEELIAALQKSSHEQLVAIAGTLNHGAAHGAHEAVSTLTNQELIAKISASGLHATHTGPIAFGGYFFGITGFHGFHVFSGVVINVVMYIKTKLGHFDQRGHYEMIEKAGLYWHFVDLVWVFVFLCFYLV